MKQLDFLAALARRDDGMDRAEQHATEEAPGWTTRALIALDSYLRACGNERFLAEEFARWALDGGYLDRPPDKRAFGPMMFKAARMGKIRKVGYAAAITSNGSPKVQWSRA